MDDMVSRVRALSLAIREGLAGETDDVEVLASCGDRTRYVIENELIVPALEYDTWSVAMRARVGGRVATAATTSGAARDSIDAMRRALSAAQRDPLEGFAAPPSIECDTRGADEAAWSLVERPGEVRALASALAEGARRARAGREIALDGELTVGRTRRAIATRHGGPAVSVATSVSAMLMVDGNDWDTVTATSLPAAGEIESLGERLVRSLPEREVTCEEFFGGPREITAVVHPRLLEALLRSLLIERVGLDRVLAGLSSAHEGEPFAHAAVTLVDDTGAARSLAGGATDDEGTAAQRKVLVADGVLKTFLSDRRSALLEGRGRASSANGFRIPILAEDVAEAPVRVGFGHLEMAAGTVARAALVPGRTLLLFDLLGIHSANKATGAFNNPIQGGLALEDGVPVARVKPGAWSATGNFFTLLRELHGLSSERLATGSALLPWLAAPVRVS